MLDLSVIVCTYRRNDLLRRVLSSLDACARPAACEWEVVVVDNSPEGAARDACESFTGTLPVRWVVEKAPGVSNVRNRGIVEANADALWFLDDDVTLADTWLGAACAAFSAHPEVGYFFGPIDPDLGSLEAPGWVNGAEMGREGHAGTYLYFNLGPSDRPLVVGDPVVSANLGLRRAAIDRVGGFRADLCPIGRRHRLGGDNDLHERLREGGIAGQYVAAAGVRHWTPPDRLRVPYALRWSYHHGWSNRYRRAIRDARNGRYSRRGALWDCVRHAAWFGIDLCRGVALLPFADQRRRVGAWMGVMFRLGRAVASLAPQPDPQLDWPEAIFRGPGLPLDSRRARTERGSA